MTMGLSQLFTSFFSYFRDKTWFLMRRGGNQYRVGAPGDFTEEALQEALLALGAANSLSEAEVAIRETYGCCFTNVTDLILYLLSSKTGLLASIDGLAGACHNVPKTGITGVCLDQRQGDILHTLAEDDPVCGLLQGASLPLSENKRVVCSTVTERVGDTVVCLAVIVCDCPTEAELQRLNLIERHIGVCMQRLRGGVAMGGPQGQHQVSSTVHDDAILQLCADLHDTDAASMQLKVIRYLEKQTNSECCTLLVVSEDSNELFCQVIGEKVLEEEVRFLIPVCCFHCVLTSKKVLRLDDIKECELNDLNTKLKVEIKSMLAVPIINQATSKVVGVACAINKRGAKKYTNADVDVIKHCFKYTVPVLTSTLALQKETQLKHETQCMLQVAKNLFTHLDDVYVLLREIMQEARNLTQAERCSLFLVENDELVAKVFDGQLESGDEVRIPITHGIAGHVASTGKILNIKDAYSHPLFYRGVDDSTGFRTKNILCFPIRDGPTVVGIAELCNKINGLFFTKHDEDVASAFSIYCGISIVHSLLYKKMKDAQYRSTLANELMMYHMEVGDDESKVLLSSEIPSIKQFSPRMSNFTYSPRSIPDSDTLKACMCMFDDMGMINRWRINRRTLAKFCMLVKRGYRDPPYHNWYHAFTVGHFCYLLYKNMDSLKVLTEIEVFALFVACLCHDLDHRGTNNSFQVHSQSVLAALYSSEGSVMERHHFAQAMCILNTEGCNIFENLNRDEYQKALDLVQDIILATDLAHHLRIHKDLEKMARDGYNVDNPEHHKLLLCMLMTCCDLSDQTKNWSWTKKIAELIYHEFFSQGDLEKAMGLETPEMFDREKACIPELQIGFLDHIALPLYRVLGQTFPQTKTVVDAVETNRVMWTKLRDETKQRRLSSTNSLDFFHIQFKSELNGDKMAEEDEDGEETEAKALEETEGEKIDHNENCK